MESTNIIHDLIDRIDECVELATLKQELLENEGKNITKDAQYHYTKVQNVEEAKGNLVQRARDLAERYCYIISGIFIGQQIVLYGAKTTKEAIFNALVDVIVVALAYNSFQSLYKHAYYKEQGKVECGSYPAYLRSLAITKMVERKNDKISKTIDNIGKDKKKLLEDKAALEEYLNYKTCYYDNLTSQLISTNNDIKTFRRKISTDMVKK